MLSLDFFEFLHQLLLELLLIHLHLPIFLVDLIGYALLIQIVLGQVVLERLHLLLLLLQLLLLLLLLLLPLQLLDLLLCAGQLPFVANIG